MCYESLRNMGLAGNSSALVFRDLQLPKVITRPAEFPKNKWVRVNLDVKFEAPSLTLLNCCFVLL